MATLTTKQQEAVKTVIAEFEIDTASDYTRMQKELINIGLRPNNKFIWACINKVASNVEEYDTDFL